MHTAANIVRALKGKWYGAYGMCRCPGHEDHTPSLSVSDSNGHILVHCHAGCSQQALIDALRQRGLWHKSAAAQAAPKTLRAAARAVSDSSKIVNSIWRQSRDAAGSIVERYLRKRAVALPPAGADALRFQPSLKHAAGGTWPAMVAAITDAVTGTLIGIHRTYLDPASGGKAPVAPQKMILGRKRGGVIRLVADDEIGQRIAHAEGIETALTAIAAGWACWASIDAGNMASLPVWPWMDLSVFVDHDPAGIAAGRSFARRWVEAGGSALVITAPAPGSDWNDEARALGAAP